MYPVTSVACLVKRVACLESPTLRVHTMVAREYERSVSRDEHCLSNKTRKVS